MSRAAVSVLALLMLAPSCKQCALERSVSRDPAAPRGPAVPLPSPKVAPVGNARGPGRIVLDARTRERLERAARERSAAFLRVEARCDLAVEDRIASGYQGWDWADAVASLSLCWHATGRARYGEAAVGYVRAMLDDRFHVGDGKGGEGVVRHDSGYGIRTFGAYTALGYDWLRGAPGMDEELRRTILIRLGQWLDWYGRAGYLKGHAFSNYYWGYLATLAFAGLAAAGESKEADQWLEQARRALSENVLPRYRDELAGGGYPEGWQYGEYTTAAIALVARGFQTALGVDVPLAMPWLSQLVPHHVHALLPDKGSVYDGGSWGERPAKPSAVALAAATLVLDGDRAARARFLIERDLPPLTREQAWLALLAASPGEPVIDPRPGAGTSHHLPGLGQTFLRSDWSKDAVWVSFQAGPILSEDHQHADQGHFELWRGSDALLVDGGDYEGGATVNHNTLLVDDGRRNMNYTPNQGVWGRAVKTTRFSDDGKVAVAVGEIADAYLPKCVEEGCKRRSVDKLTRSLVYVRPSLLVVDDRVELERAGDGVTWAAHVTTAPGIEGELVSARVGQSRVDIRMLEPERAERVALREPTPSRDNAHEKSSPWGPMWRIEIRSPRGERTRGFLAFISTDRASAAPPSARRVQGDGLRGAFGKSAGQDVAVLFGDAAGGRADLGGHADLVIVAGLEPGRRYRVAEETRGDCGFALRVEPDASGQVAGAGGFLKTVREPCEKR